MATKASKLLLLALSLLLISSTLARKEEGKQERRLQECKQRCSEHSQDPSQRQQCERQCQQRYEEQRGQGDEEAFNRPGKDPQRRLQECRERCQERGQQERWQCESRCQQRYEEEQRRERGRGEEAFNRPRRDPEERLEECKQDCRERGQPSQRWQCESRCQQRYEEEQRRERGRGDEAFNRPGRDPEERLEECKQDCRERGQPSQRWQCERQCQQSYEEERQRERGQEDESLNPRRQDPESRREECRRDCREGRQGQQERRQCEQECQQRYEEEQRRQRDEVNPSHQDPERRCEECRRECRQGRQGQQERLQCEQECQQRYEEEQRRQRDPQRQDPERRLQECQQECSERHQGRQHEQVQCQRQCQQRYEEEQRQRRERDDVNPQREEEKEGEERTGQNPYVFQSDSFRHRVRTEHGNIRVLQNFAQKSKLLVGIANYRIVMLEADPNTFVVPTHFDAEVVIYVVRGEGTITKIRGNQDRESHNIKQGDILKISAGTVVYLINKSNNQKLQLAKILQPVSTPGQWEDFQTVGGDNPESYYRVFSTEILEAALNTRRDKLDRLLGQQRQGVIIRASQEQIRSMSRHSSNHDSHWPFGGGSKSSGPFNLLTKRPTHSNQHGRLHEADCNDYQPLRDLDLQVSVANISSNSMMAPFFNSKSTKIAIVTNGRGYFEMVCPHLSKQQERRQESEERGGQRYQKVRAKVSKNTLFVVPTGHPVAIVAERGENLEVVCFEVNAEGNRRTFVAGRDNVVSKMEREAKELAFGVPSKLVDEVFGGKQEEVFVRGPQGSSEKREEERSHPLESILEFAGF